MKMSELIPNPYAMKSGDKISGPDLHFSPPRDGHAGDCTIYSALCNGNPEDGICTCGYGHKLRIRADYSEMYSEERLKTMEKRKNA